MGRAAIGGMGRLGLVRALAIGFWVVFAVAPATAQLQPSVAHLAEELLDAVVSISTSHRVTTRDHTRPINAAKTQAFWPSIVPVDASSCRTRREPAG